LYTGNPPLLLAFLGGAEDILRVLAGSPYGALALGISMPIGDDGLPVVAQRQDLDSRDGLTEHVVSHDAPQWDETSRPFDVILSGIPPRRHLGWDAAEKRRREKKKKKKRMMGLEPHDLLHGKRLVGSSLRASRAVWLRGIRPASPRS
jgi:hypothetical protein